MDTEEPSKPTAASPTQRPRAASRPLHWALLFAVALLAVFLRTHQLSDGGIWLDEGYSLLVSENRVLDFLRLNEYEPHPPLHFLLLRGWRAMFGEHWLTAKYSSVLVGVIGVVAVGFACRRYAGSIAGVLGALLVAIHPLHLTHSREIRGYALVFAMFALSTAFFLAWRRRRSRALLLAWIVSTWAAVNAEYFAWYFFAAQVGVTFLTEPTRRRTLLVAACAVALASTQSLWAFGMQVTAEDQNFAWVPRPGLTDLRETLRTFGLGSLLGVLLVGGGALLGAVRKLLADDRNERIETLILLLQLTLPLTIFALSLVSAPAYRDRHFLICLVPLALLWSAGLAAGFGRAGRSRAAVAIAAGALAAYLAVAPTQALYAKQRLQHRGVERAEAIAAGVRDGDVVVYASKYIFVTTVAMHPSELEEYTLATPTIALEKLVPREVEFQPPPPGLYQRLWLVAYSAETLDKMASNAWFRELDPRLLPELSRPQVRVYELGASAGAAPGSS